MSLRYKVSRVLAAMTIVVVVAGCGDNTPVAPVDPFENPSTIRVVNALNGPVLFFYARTCGTQAWGDDLLPLDPEEGTIQPGSTKEFTVEAGCYDLWARHLETIEPGPLVDKREFDQQTSQVTALVWVLAAEPTTPS